jgi:hypothetical protein
MMNICWAAALKIRDYAQLDELREMIRNDLQVSWRMERINLLQQGSPVLRKQIDNEWNKRSVKVTERRSGR